MTIKNILVSFNGGLAAKTALKTALVMAERYDAHLTGILTHGLPSAIYSYGGQVPQSVIDQLEDADKAHRSEVKSAFERMTADHPEEKTHYIDSYGNADEMLMEAALGYDLVVMGSFDKRSDYPHMEVHPDVVARHSGKPVLIVPNGYNAQEFNESLLLAWDGRRAASRAMSDAIKLMNPDARITVISIGDQSAAEVKAVVALSHLERHGFAPKLITRSSRKIAKTLLAAAEEKNAGMLVMGAYEHAKLAEDLFGGVTNTVLKKADIPVLLSH